MTRAQVAHLRTAEAGALYVNWRGGPVRRWVGPVGGKVSQQVCERLVGADLITLTEIPGCSVMYRGELTGTGHAALEGNQR